MLRQCRARSLAEPGDNVDNTIWYSCLLDQFAEAEGGVEESAPQVSARSRILLRVRGPVFHAAIMIGKFQGMIWPTTPTGSRSV